MISQQPGQSRSGPAGAYAGRRPAPQQHQFQRFMDVFEVIVDVIGATDLSLSSTHIGSSLFCSVHVDGLHIGSTPVLPRSQSPTWNHTIRAPLSAVKNVLVVLKIYSQNMGLDNDILIGVASLPLEHQGMIGPMGSTLSWPLQDGSGSLSVRIMTRYFRDMTFLRSVSSGSEKDILFKPPNHVHNIELGILNRPPRLGATLNSRVVDGMLANCHLFATHHSRSMYRYMSEDIQSVFETTAVNIHPSSDPLLDTFHRKKEHFDGVSVGSQSKAGSCLMLAVRGSNSTNNTLRLSFQNTFDLLSLIKECIGIGISMNISGVNCLAPRVPERPGAMGVLVSKLDMTVSVAPSADSFAGNLFMDVKDIVRASASLKHPQVYHESSHNKSFILSLNLSWVDVREHAKTNASVSNVHVSSIPFTAPAKGGDVVKLVAYVSDTHEKRRFVGVNGTTRCDSGQLSESLIYYHGSVDIPIYFDESSACGGFKVSVYAELLHKGNAVSSVCLCDQFVAAHEFFEAAAQQNSNIFVTKSSANSSSESSNLPLYKPILNLKMKIENKSRVFRMDCIGLQRIQQYFKSDCSALIAYQLLSSEDQNAEYNWVSEEDLKALRVKGADSEFHITITESNCILVATFIRISLLILDVNDRTSFSHVPVAYFDVPVPLHMRSSSDADVKVTKYAKYEWNICPAASDSALSLVSLHELFDGYVLVNCFAELGPSSASKLPFEATAKISCKLTRQEACTVGWPAIVDVGHDSITEYPISMWQSNATPPSLSRSEQKEYLSVSLVQNKFIISRFPKQVITSKDCSAMPLGKMIDYLVMSSHEGDASSSSKLSFIEVYQVVPALQNVDLLHDTQEAECYLLNENCQLRFPLQKLSNRKDTLLDLHSQFEFVGDWICDRPESANSTQDDVENWEYSIDISSFADPLFTYKVPLPACKYKRRKWVRALARRTLASKSFDEVHQGLGEFLPPLEPYSGPYDFIDRQYSRLSELEKRPSLTIDAPVDGTAGSTDEAISSGGKEFKRRTSVAKRNSFVSQDQLVDLVVQNPWPSASTQTTAPALPCAVDSVSDKAPYESSSGMRISIDVSCLKRASTVSPGIIWLQFELDAKKLSQNDANFRSLFPASDISPNLECFVFVPNAAEMGELINTVRLVNPIRSMIIDAIPQVRLCRESQSARYSLGILHRSWEVMHQERVKIATVLKRLRNYARGIVTDKAAEMHLEKMLPLAPEDPHTVGTKRFFVEHYDFMKYKGDETLLPVELNDLEVSMIDQSLLLPLTILELYHSILLVQTLDLSSSARISDFCLADSEDNSRIQNPFDEPIPKLSLLPTKKSKMSDEGLIDSMDSLSLSAMMTSRSRTDTQSLPLPSSPDALPKDGTAILFRSKSSLQGPESFVPPSSKRKQMRHIQKSTLVFDVLRQIESLFDDTEMQILLSHSVATILSNAAVADASTSCRIQNMIVTRWFRQMASSISHLMKREVKSIDSYKLSHDLPSSLLEAIGTTHFDDDIDELSPLSDNIFAYSSRPASNTRHMSSSARNHIETYLPVSSYLLQSNGRLSLLLESVASTSTGKELSQTAIISHFADIKAVVEWELKPRIDFVYGWCMSFASVDFAQFVKLTAPRSSGSHERKLWSKSTADTTDSFLSRHATDRLTAAEELCLVFQEFLLPGAHELFLADIRDRYSVFNETGSRNSTTPPSTSSDSKMHKRPDSDMYFASSAILKRHGRLATFRHSHSFHSNVKDVSRSIYFTLVETFRVRNILYLNAVRQVIHRCLQMLQIHYSDTLRSYAWFAGSEGGGSPQRRSLPRSASRESPNTGAATPSHIAQLRKDISLVCLVANDCIDFNVLAEECYLALSTSSETQQRATGGIDVSTTTSDASIRFGSSAASGGGSSSGGQDAGASRGLAAILRRTAEQREQGILQVVARFEQSYFIRFGSVADEFARMSMECMFKLVDMLLAEPDGSNSPLVSHSGSTIRDIIGRAKLVISDIRGQLMNGLFCFFIRLFLERVIELIVSNLALDMDGNMFFYALAIDDCSESDANKLSQQQLLQDLRMLRSFCFAACLEVIPIEKVLRAYGEVPPTLQFEATDTAGQQGDDINGEASTSSAGGGGNRNRFARMDSRSMLNKMGAVVNKISAATKPATDEASISTDDLMKQLHEQWSFVQAVHPELGGFLSSLERRLELELRGVNSGDLCKQLPQACDIITAVRSVDWISRSAGRGMSSAHNSDVYVLLNLPSFRSKMERSFWFGDANSSSAGVGGNSASMRKQPVAPLTVQVKLVSICSLQYHHGFNAAAPASSGPNVFAEVWFVGSGLIRHKYTSKIRNNDRFGCWTHLCQHTFDSCRMSECVDEVVIVLLEHVKGDKTVRPLGYSKVQVLSIDVCVIDAHYAIYPIDMNELEWRRVSSGHRLPEVMVTTAHQRYRGMALDRDLNSIGDMHIGLSSTSTSNLMK